MAPRNICVRVFGKPFSELSHDEYAVFHRAVRAANYYRSYELGKSAQRSDKRGQKARLLEVLGWDAKCMRCGYARYVGALDFHHIDPNTKSGVVKTVAEALKCQLLCANCHREAHRDMRLLGSGGRGGRPPKALHPSIEKYLSLVGVTRPAMEEAA